MVNAYRLFCFFCLAVIFCPVFAESRCVEGDAYKQKLKGLQDQCAQISKMVPCAVAESPKVKNNFDPVLFDFARDKARIELAKTIKVFVSSNSNDSSWIENGELRRNLTAINKVSLDKFELFGSNEIDNECGEFKESGGVTVYYAVVLMVLDKGLYTEAVSEIKKAEGPTVAAVADAKASAVKKASTEQVVKLMAAKTASLIWNVGKKFIGIP